MLMGPALATSLNVCASWSSRQPTPGNECARRSAPAPVQFPPSAGGSPPGGTRSPSPAPGASEPPFGQAEGVTRGGRRGSGPAPRTSGPSSRSAPGPSATSRPAPGGAPGRGPRPAAFSLASPSSTCLGQECVEVRQQQQRSHSGARAALPAMAGGGRGWWGATGAGAAPVAPSPHGSPRWGDTHLGKSLGPELSFWRWTRGSWSFGSKKGRPTAERIRSRFVGTFSCFRLLPPDRGRRPEVL